MNRVIADHVMDYMSLFFGSTSGELSIEELLKRYGGVGSEIGAAEKVDEKERKSVKTNKIAGMQLSFD